MNFQGFIRSYTFRCAFPAAVIWSALLYFGVIGGTLSYLPLIGILALMMFGAQWSVRYPREVFTARALIGGMFFGEGALEIGIGVFILLSQQVMSVPLLLFGAIGVLVGGWILYSSYQSELYRS